MSPVNQRNQPSAGPGIFKLFDRMNSKIRVARRRGKIAGQRCGNRLADGGGIPARVLVEMDVKSPDRRNLQEI